ncbi:hypothetical protein IT409_02465 [Candidatus Falkowbacteria bacterium]|nr:hypothetical protein [Candidatus Falkowbacteria bacterium]
MDKQKAERSHVKTGGHWVHRRASLVRQGDLSSLRRFRKKTKARPFFTERSDARAFKGLQQGVFA